MSSLLAELSAVLGSAFASENLAETFGTVQLSDRPDLAQFQCNGALAAAKEAKANPRAIAERVVARLKSTALFTRVGIAGPGFINFDVSDSVLADRVAALAASIDAPVTSTRSMIIDYGGANIAKAMHVGHLRSAIIGDCLKRLFRANGWRVTSDVHLGDWGLQIGQLIAEIDNRGLAPLYFDEAHKGPYPDESPLTMRDLEDLYPAGAAAASADPARLEKARAATAELQAGRAGYRALWQHLAKISKAGLAREYESLGVSFDLWNGESDVDALIPPMIADLKQRHIARESEGALVIAVARNSDRKEMPPLILLKSDGAVTYGTTDLAAIVDRVRSFDPDLILYVVDQRQAMHFEQVYRAAEIAGLNGRARLEHAGFGTMNGTDGKPFKTRAGGVLKLQDLIASATEEAEKRLGEQGLAQYSAEEHAEIARKVAIATIKFADLSNHRGTDYIFDLARFSRFEGKTGPYLQYAAVRIQSILRKAADEGIELSPPVIRSSEERTLVLRLLQLPDILAAAEEKRAPNILCDYIFILAQEFSRFYGEHHILSEKDVALRSARLGLCRLTLSALVKILFVLGIEVPERM